MGAAIMSTVSSSLALLLSETGSVPDPEIVAVLESVPVADGSIVQLRV